MGSLPSGAARAAAGRGEARGKEARGEDAGRKGGGEDRDEEERPGTRARQVAGFDPFELPGVAGAAFFAPGSDDPEEEVEDDDPEDSEEEEDDDESDDEPESEPADSLALARLPFAERLSVL
jgi:hypothetical protein